MNGTDLLLDHDQPLGALLPSQKDLIDNMLLVQEHVVPRSDFDGWARQLRFLQCPSHITGAELLSSEELTLTLTEKTAYPDETAYIAVSYCWSSSPSARTTRHGPKYMIQTGNDTNSIRPCRAPPNILDRVILYALHHDLSLIWIDQECIDQDDPQDLAQGVQCMDEVYSRSQYPVGLLCVEIQDHTIAQVFQRLLADLEHKSTAKRKGTGTSSPRWYNDEVDAHAIGELTTVLQNIAADRWFSRSWTYQEATCAHNTMEMLVVVAGGQTQTVETGELGHYRHHPHQPQHDVAFRLSALYTTSNWILNRARKFSKRRTRPEIPGWHIMAQLCFQAWEQNTRHSPRPCDYQVADCLQQRGNLVVSDRLAITANLCGYTNRLNASVLATQIASYSVCALGLALLNGSVHPQGCLDMFASSPAPQSSSDGSRARQPWRNMQLRELLEGPRSRSGEYSGPRYDEPRLPNVSLSASGLQTSGWLWRVDQKVELPGLQAKYNRLLEQQHGSLNPGERSQNALRIAMLATVHEIRDLGMESLATTLEACWGVPPSPPPPPPPPPVVPEQLEFGRAWLADDFTRGAFRSQPRVWKMVEKILLQEYLWCGTMDGTVGDTALQAVFDVEEPCMVFTSSEKAFENIAKPYAAYNFFSFLVSSHDALESFEENTGSDEAMILYPGTSVMGLWFPSGVPPLRYVFPWAQETLTEEPNLGNMTISDYTENSLERQEVVAVKSLIPAR